MKGAPLDSDQYGNGPFRDGKFTTFEGGIRVPSFVRWKGVFAPRVTDAIVGTYDIFPTVLATAKVPLPDNVIIDGRDLTPVLRNSKASEIHECIFSYFSPQNRRLDYGGIGAVRCGRWKAHYYVHITGPGSNHSRTTLREGPQDPPALFDIIADPSESHPINTATTSTASAVVALINAAVAEHLATVQSVPNQMLGVIDCHINTDAPSCVGGNDNAYAVCSAPNSQKTHPHEANCSLTPQYYGTAQCRAKEGTGGGCIAKCMPWIPAGDAGRSS